MIPKTTNPLAKSIRTGEGILIWITNVGLVIFSAINPSELSPEIAGIVVSALSALHLVSRTMLKVTAVQKNVGIESPIPFDVQKLADKVSSNIVGRNINFNISDQQIKSIADRIPALIKEPIKTIEKDLEGTEEEVSHNIEVLPTQVVDGLPADGDNSKVAESKVFDQEKFAPLSTSETTSAPIPVAAIPSGSPTSGFVSVTPTIATVTNEPQGGSQ